MIEMLQIEFNYDGEPKIAVGDEYRLLRLFIQDDLVGSESCDAFANACVTALSGDEQDLSANSCGVTITTDAVTIEHMFIDDLAVRLALDDFKRLLEWKRKILCDN